MSSYYVFILRSLFIYFIQHFFEEPEGRAELPGPLKEKVHSWRRFQDIISDGKVCLQLLYNHVSHSFSFPL